MTTRVGVNLLWLVPGEVGGSETWMIELLTAVLADPPADVEVVAFATAAFVEAYPGIAGSLEMVHAPALVGSSRPGRVLAESSWLAIAARRAKVDVLHHAGGTIPLLRATPALLTIHDLQPLAFPEHFSPVKRMYLRARLGPSARHARLVTAVSEFTAADVATRLRVDAAEIMLTPPAVDPDPEPSGVDAATVAAAHRLPARWFVYPAITYPHKNHAVLLRALAQLRPSHGDVALVLTGGAGSAEPELRALSEQLGIADLVRRPGRVAADHLDRLYRGAVACTFPSKFEAVGLPMLEAMARDCPVIAADTAGVRETVGDAGDLVPADDATAWVDAMRRLLDDNEHRRARVAAGRSRVKAWEPQASAARLVDAWRAGAR